MAVELTTLIQFGDIQAANNHIIFELDETLNVNADGSQKTQFIPGDEIFFRIQLSNGVEIQDIIPTLGTVQGLGTVSRESTEQVNFVSRQEDSPTIHRLNYIPTGPIGIEYFGRTGAVTRSQAGNTITSYTGNINAVPFIAKFTYNFRVQSYRLLTPVFDLSEGETFPILIVLYLKTPAETLDNGCKS